VLFSRYEASTLSDDDPAKIPSPPEYMSRMVPTSAAVSCEWRPLVPLLASYDELSFALHGFV